MAKQLHLLIENETIGHIESIKELIRAECGYVPSSSDVVRFSLKRMAETLAKGKKAAPHG